MKIRSAILLGGLILAFAGTPEPGLIAAQDRPQNQNEAWTGSVEQKVWGLMTIWATAKANFPFFDQRPGLDWDKKAREYIPRVIAAPDMAAYYDVLCEFAALLKDGHTAVNRPGGFFDPSLDWPPLEVQVVDGAYLVARMAETEDLKRNAITRGSEIVEIDGAPAAAYFQDRIARFESRGTRHADEAISIFRLLVGPTGSGVNLKLREPDGREQTVRLIRDARTPDGGRFFFRLLESYINQESPIEVRRLEGGIVYIRIANFGSEKVVPEFMKAFDAEIGPSVKGMMLDIRFNPGGDDTLAFPVIGCFFDAPVPSFRWKSPKYVPAKASWGMPLEWEEGSLGPDVIEIRQGKRYTGPLVILTGPATFSTAEDFCIPFDFAKRAVLVGETTAGSTGNPIRIPLPGGGDFRVVTLRTVYPDGREWVGAGIKPGVTVRPTREDIRRGEDPVLKKGLEVLKNWDRFRPAKSPAGRP